MINLWVFDDDREYLEICTAALREAHFEVIPFDTADDVARAIRNPITKPPDGAVLDIQVGNAGDNRGFALAGDIKDRWKSVQVFFMTSYAHGEKEHIQALDYQAHFISKHAWNAREVLVRNVRIWIPEDRKAWRHVGSLSIHLPSGSVYWRRKEQPLDSSLDPSLIDLDHSQKEIVLALTHRPGTVFSYEQIREETGIGRFRREDLEDDDPPERADKLMKNLIQTQMKNIRAAFAKVELAYAQTHSTKPIKFKRVLQTERGTGYRWNKF